MTADPPPPLLDRRPMVTVGAARTERPLPPQLEQSLAWWRVAHVREPWYRSDRVWDDYLPACRLGLLMGSNEARDGVRPLSPHVARPEMIRRWESGERAGSRLSAQEAWPVVQAAWLRWGGVESAAPRFAWNVTAPMPLDTALPAPPVPKTEGVLAMVKRLRAGIGAGLAVMRSRSPWQRHDRARAEAAWWLAHQVGQVRGSDDRSHAGRAPAFRFGLEQHALHPGRRFERVEPLLRAAWERRRGADGLSWSQAREAVRAAWRRLEREV